MTIDDTIRTLDPARSVPSDTDHRRADALLERIVRDEGPARATPKPYRWGRRIGILVVAGAAATAVALVVPAISAPSAAVASWTPIARPVSAADRDVAQRACLQSAGSSMYQDLPNELAERRGNVVALVSWQDDPNTTVTCVVDLPEGRDTAGEAHVGRGGGSGPVSVPAPGQFMEGAISTNLLGGQWLSATTGTLGEGVVGVTIHAGDATAEATVRDGRYAAWVPGNALPESSAQGGQGGPRPILTYDLTLADGTVIENATSARP